LLRNRRFTSWRSGTPHFIWKVGWDFTSRFMIFSTSLVLSQFDGGIKSNYSAGGKLEGWNWPLCFNPNIMSRSQIKLIFTEQLYFFLWIFLTLLSIKIFYKTIKDYPNSATYVTCSTYHRRYGSEASRSGEKVRGPQTLTHAQPSPVLNTLRRSGRYTSLTTIHTYFQCIRSSHFINSEHRDLNPEIRLPHTVMGFLFLAKSDFKRAFSFKNLISNVHIPS